MTRFFVDAAAIAKDRVCLGPADSHHLLRVLRQRPGQRFVVVAAGQAYAVELIGSEGGRALGRIVGQEPAGGEPPVEVILFQGLAKGDKMDLVVQKGTELGVTAFVPVITARSVVRLDAAKAADRIVRWQRVARAAAAQCRRGAVPVVESIIDWAAAVQRAAAVDLALVPWEEGGRPLRAVLSEFAAATRPRVAVYIGPEGGLTAAEATAAAGAGAQIVTLGPRILRTETAGLALVAVLLYALGDL